MSMTPTKENTLYLVIKQVYFDAILAGTMKQEFREIKSTTYEKFLETQKENGKIVGINFDESKISKEDAQKYACNPMVYNNGIYPYIAIPYQFLDIAVGYKKDRETLIVAVEDIHFEPMRGKHGKEARFSDDGERMRIDENGELCIWQIVYTLGKIVETDLKEDRAK
jgi:hypothetical protein